MDGGKITKESYLCKEQNGQRCSIKMLMKKIIYCFFASLLLMSCEVKVNTPTTEGSGGKIRNGIQLKEDGLKAEQAFLVFEDGKLMPSDNKIYVGQWVGLRLILNGWQKKDGKVFVDAEEQ